MKSLSLSCIPIKKESRERLFLFLRRIFCCFTLWRIVQLMPTSVNTREERRLSEPEGPIDAPRELVGAPRELVGGEDQGFHSEGSSAFEGPRAGVQRGAGRHDVVDEKGMRRS